MTSQLISVEMTALTMKSFLQKLRYIRFLEQLLPDDIWGIVNEFKSSMEFGEEINQCEAAHNYKEKYNTLPQITLGIIKVGRMPLSMLLTRFFGFEADHFMRFVTKNMIEWDVATYYWGICFEVPLAEVGAIIKTLQSEKQTTVKTMTTEANRYIGQFPQYIQGELRHLVFALISKLLRNMI